jgi:hypothetical protein
MDKGQQMDWVQFISSNWWLWAMIGIASVITEKVLEEAWMRAGGLSDCSLSLQRRRCIQRLDTARLICVGVLGTTGTLCAGGLLITLIS